MSFGPWSHITRRALGAPLRRLLPAPKAPATADVGRVAFRCNLCNADCQVQPAAISRETRSCRGCGSTVRTRAIVHLLTTELFGRSIALPEVPERSDIVGIGLSDSVGYATGLARKFSYTNTFFHTDPRFDITEPPSISAQYDFIIASEVFEHVAPPVSRAFVNARRLLKPNGVFIFSVPFTLADDTTEHFPDLYDHRLVEIEGAWRLENVTVKGVAQTFDGLVFHGGPGSTLEMRVFSRAALRREFAHAGFANLRIADDAYPRHGIVWPEPSSVPMVARAN